MSKLTAKLRPGKSGASSAASASRRAGRTGHEAVFGEADGNDFDAHGWFLSGFNVSKGIRANARTQVDLFKPAGWTILKDHLELSGMFRLRLARRGETIGNVSMPDCERVRSQCRSRGTGFMLQNSRCRFARYFAGGSIANSNCSALSGQTGFVSGSERQRATIPSTILLMVSPSPCK